MNLVLADVVDPLAGSYYVEWLTDEMEEACVESNRHELNSAGGMVEASQKEEYRNVK